jgi:hypothetical protein
MKPETAAQVRERIAEIIELADHDVDLLRSRAAEQEVLDLPMSPQPGDVWLRTWASPGKQLMLYVLPPTQPARAHTK